MIGVFLFGVFLFGVALGGLGVGLLMRLRAMHHPAGLHELDARELIVAQRTRKGGRWIP